MNTMNKYKFKIVTRNNIVIDKLVIAGIDFENARSKLDQMYRYCEVTEWSIEDNLKQDSTDFDKVLDLITRTE